ncbi:MAG TPA: sensor histidine kinase [Gaiellaceae bacterium]|nr:sensor histidine kinase [Gaiellaceae bacterium]
MSGETRELVERAWATLARVGAAAQRLLSRPDGPLAVALLLALAAIVEVTFRAEDVGSAMIANLLATLPIALVRQRLPWAAGAIVFGVVVALSGDTALLTVAGAVALAAVVYLFAARYGRRWSVLLVLPFLFNVATPFSGNDARLSGLLLLVVVVAALALGDARRQRGRAVAERDEAQRDQALMEERARIARELHDIVAHHVSMIAVQAETARLTTPGLPEEGEQRFKAIGDTARDSLSELRRLLGVLREDASGEAERTPQPGLADLVALVDAAREAGTQVRLTMIGRAESLSPGVDLTAYRIAQEALTNARRHAPGAEVDVELRYETDTLHLEVRDNGPGVAAEANGHGIVGMRERAEMVGGTLHAGPAAGGGFAVSADLPIEERRT